MVGGVGGGGVFLVILGGAGILGRAVILGFPNPDPISDQKRLFSTTISACNEK